MNFVDTLQYILSYLSYLVAWQGIFAFAWTVLLISDHFRGKSEGDDRSVEIEKFKLWFLPVWFSLTFIGFYNDAVSVPAFEQAHSIRKTELGFLLAYVSIFGSLICLLYAPYKFAVAIPYVLKNRGRPNRKWSITDDEFFGSIMEIEKSLYTTVTADLEVTEGHKIDIMINYPPPEDIPETSRERIRGLALSKARDFVKEAISLESAYREEVARHFLKTRSLIVADQEFNADEIAAQLTLLRIECEFETEGDGTQLELENYRLDYSNKNPFGEEEISVDVAKSGPLQFVDSYGMLTPDEERLVDDEELESLLLPSVPEIDNESLQHLEKGEDAGADAPNDLKPSHL